jgi:(5-formylfuran-3-yl)methyl phosphate synthase
MTWMLATVTGPEEAEIAVSGGADIICFADPRAAFLSQPDLDALRSVVHAVAGRRRVSASIGIVLADPDHANQAVRAVAATGVDAVLVPLPASTVDRCLRGLSEPARETRLIAVLLADRGAQFHLIEPLADAGFAGAMLDITDKSKGRLLDYVDPEHLARFVSLCRAKGLAAGFAGALEAPDVPRLLALRPDTLGFRGALCHRHDRRAGLDPAAVAAIRRLIPHGEPTAGRAAADSSDGDGPPQFDRVFVRDFVLQVSIGAYRHERDTPQRVRFDVTAEVRRRFGTGDEIGDVFSYDVILDTIRALVANRHVNLVETLAEEIAARLLDHEAVAAVTVRVEKLDVAPAVVGVEIVRRAPSRSD